MSVMISGAARLSAAGFDSKPGLPIILIQNHQKPRVVFYAQKPH